MNIKLPTAPSNFLYTHVMDKYLLTALRTVAVVVATCAAVYFFPKSRGQPGFILLVLIAAIFVNYTLIQRVLYDPPICTMEECPPLPAVSHLVCYLLSLFVLPGSLGMICYLLNTLYFLYYDGVLPWDDGPLRNDNDGRVRALEVTVRALEPAVRALELAVDRLQTQRPRARRNAKR
jgi:hypothetical protein